MRESGGRIRVCTTGVGTPDSQRIVTAASPVPSWVSSSRGRRIGLRERPDGRAQRLRVVGRERAERVLDAVAELAEHVGGQSFGVWVTKNTPTPFERISRTVCVDRLDERLARALEEQVRLVEEEDELRLVPVARPPEAARRARRRAT